MYTQAVAKGLAKLDLAAGPLARHQRRLDRDALRAANGIGRTEQVIARAAGHRAFLFFY